MATVMTETVPAQSQKKPKFSQFTELSSEKLVSKVLFATDDCYAVAENLLKSEPPVWKEGLFTAHGKWMDGWATRRRKTEGHDWCIIQLGVPGIVHGIDVDTSYFTGNYAPRCSIQAACVEKNYSGRKGKLGSTATEEQIEDMNRKLLSEDWEYIVPMSDLRPGYKTSCHNYFTTNSRKRFTHIRLNIYPDGGIARLRIYGQGTPDWSCIPGGQLVDLVSLKNGGLCIGYSNAHYGHPRNLTTPGRAENEGEGWETARNPNRPAIVQPNTQGVIQTPGSEWCVFRLGHPGVVHKIEVDTTHFRGNFPDTCRIEGCYIPESHEEEAMKRLTGEPWRALLPVTKLGAHKQHYFFGSTLRNCGIISHVRLTIFPDGGVSRLRLWGYRETKPGSKL